jgi:hypothetical protein
LHNDRQLRHDTSLTYRWVDATPEPGGPRFWTFVDRALTTERLFSTRYGRLAHAPPMVERERTRGALSARATATLLITGGGRRATRAVMCMTRALPIARRPTLRQSLPSRARKPRARTAVRLSCRRSVD